MDYMQKEEAQGLFQILIEISKKDDDAKELWEEVLEASNRYGKLRENWETATFDEKLNMDESRSLLHDVVIIKLNQYARWAEKQDYDTTWRTHLGDVKKDPTNRRRIGDLACWIYRFSK